MQTLAPTNVSFTSATFEGLVNPHGSDTTAYFEWGTTTNYGNVTTQTDIGTAAETFSVTSAWFGATTITGLTPPTAWARAEGLDIQFTTP